MVELRNPYVSVTQLNQLLQSVFDRNLPLVSFRGEISEISRPPSGHLYCTLKDENSQVSIVMWKGQASTLNFQIKTGIEVLCQGKPVIYQRGGRLQIVVHRMTLAGDGLLQQKFFELKSRLGSEGLFAPERKRPLPFLPASIGVVTSSTGAVIHDIMVKIRERMPGLRVYLVDVRVQGPGASDEIAAGIELLNKSRLVDVIIVARGGGSLEDLWAFNEESTVRAIAASKVPVISGVGHEVDFSLSDLAADVRAPTPTAAAEIVVPHRRDLMQKLEGLGKRLSETDRWLLPKAQQFDEVSERLDRSMVRHVRDMSMQLDRMAGHMRVMEPLRFITLLRQKLSHSAESLSSAGRRFFDSRRSELEILSHQLGALNPRKVLERGYSVVQSEGRVVTSVDQVERGDAVSVLLADGALKGTVTDKLAKWNDLKGRK